MIFPGSWRMRKAGWVGVISLAAWMPAAVSAAPISGAPLFSAPLFSSKEKMDPPQWGLDAAKTRTPEYVKDAPAVILYDETLDPADAQGRATERRRQVIRLLKPQARENYHNPCSVSYDVDDKVNYFRAWTIA